MRPNDAPLAEIQQQPAVNDQVANQVVNVDQNALVQGPQVLPLSLSVDAGGNLTDGGLTAQILQGLEGLQLQLGQGIQITGLDPSLLNQTFQIDASVLQHLQGNVNLTINQNLVGQTIQAADPNLVQNIQIQQVAPTDVVNPNIIIQQGGLQQQPETSQATPATSELAQVASLDSTSAQGACEQQIVTLPQQPELQQVTFQTPQLMQTTDGLTLAQTPEVIQTAAMEPEVPEEEGSDDEDAEASVSEAVGDNLGENLVADDDSMVLASTTDTSVLDEQQDAVTGRDPSLMQAQTIVTVTPGDSDRTHVCQVRQHNSPFTSIFRTCC